MASPDEILAALRKADAAGNTADAKALADAYRAVTSQQQKPVAKPQTMMDRIMQLNPMLAGARDIGEGAAKFATGIVGGVTGDAAGLGAIVADATGLAKTNPAAVRDFVANSLTYQPRQESGTSKILDIPSRLIGGAGEYLKNKTQATSDSPGVQFAGDVAGAVPLALASWLGLKGGAGLKGGRPVSLAGDTEATALRSAPGVVPVESRAASAPAIPTQIPKPTPQATPLTAGQRLRSQGADITPGMAKPGGIANALETTFQRVPVAGELIREARRAGNEGIQKVVMEQAAAPGATIKPGSPSEMLTQAYESFEPLYKQAKGFPVTGVPLENAFKLAAKDRKVQATDSTRATTADWLDNKLTELQPKPGKPLDSGQLIDLRSDLRLQIRKNRLSGDPAKMDSADLMANAERAVTQTLEAQLPAQAVATLRAADQRYGVYKIVENAVAKAKDNPAGFSAENLSQAIKEATDKGSYARGGGRLRQLAQDWKTTAGGGAPQTGIVAPVIGGALLGAVAHPAVAIPVGAAALALTTTRLGRSLVGGRLGNALASESRNALGAPIKNQLNTLRRSTPVAGYQQERR